MPRADRSGHNAAVCVLALVIAGGSWLAWTNPAIQRKPAGFPQLVSVQPLPQPAVPGQICEWSPASTQSSLRSAVQEQEQTASGKVRTSVTLDRPPVREIRDPSPTFSAVAVDPRDNEIVLQDENLFQLMIYDRMTNTPASASFSEPKRVIGGLRTDMEFNCGLYVDPQSGDIYSVANDTVDTMVVFSRQASGNVPPDRELHIPHRGYALAVNEASKELFLTVQDPPMVVVYNKYAQGKDKPLRVLRGNHTGMADAHGIGLDTKNGWIFVSNFGGTASYPDSGGNSLPHGGMAPGSGRYQPPSITVYPIQASGDTPPLRTIAGPKTMLNWPAHIYVDDQHGEVFVANDADDSVLVFKVTDDGDVAPTRVLKGPRTQIKNPTGVFVDVAHDELAVANMGNHRATIYARTAQGDSPPLRAIRNADLNSQALMIGNPGSVAYDSKRDTIIVPN